MLLLPSIRGMGDPTRRMRWWEGIEEKLAAILDQLRGHEDDIMWEAARTGQQAQLILGYGPNVSLGNVKPRDVLGLEALRRGLRYETFRQFSSQLEPTEIRD